MIHLKRILYWFCVSCRPNKSRTVTFAYPIALASILFLGAAAMTSQNSSYIKLTTTDSDVFAGERFTIDVLVGAHVAVNAVDLEITFPEDQIEIKGIDQGESVITIWTQDPKVEGNKVILSGGTFRKGFIGEHLIAQINAEAKQNGSAKFSVDTARILAGDGQGSQVSISETGEESLTVFVALSDGEDSSLIIEGGASVGIYTDINGDGKVDMNDIRSFMNAWGEKNKLYDFNDDGKMSFVDFAIILAISFVN